MYEIEKFGCLGILEHFVTKQCIVYLFNNVPAYPVSKHVWGTYAMRTKGFNYFIISVFFVNLDDPLKLILIQSHVRFTDPVFCFIHVVRSS